MEFTYLESQNLFHLERLETVLVVDSDIFWNIQSRCGYDILIILSSIYAMEVLYRI